jgi:thiol:disulfide interchange protein DsbD
MFVRFSHPGVAALLLVVLAATAPPRAAGAEARRVEASVTVAAASADSLTLLWEFALADGWHLYGPFRNDTGLAPRLSLELPPDWQAGEPTWPAPERHVVAGDILDHVYHGRLAVLQPLAVPPGVSPREITAQARWLVCSDICVPGDTTLTVTLPAAPDAAARDRLGDVAAALPGPLPTDRFSARREGDRVVLRAPGAQELAFFPAAAGPLLADLARDGLARGEQLVLHLDPTADATAPLQGLLSIHHKTHGRTVGWVTIP